MHTLGAALVWRIWTRVRARVTAVGSSIPCGPVRVYGHTALTRSSVPVGQVWVRVGTWLTGPGLVIPYRSTRVKLVA